MNALHITAIRPAERRPIKRKAHLFSLLALLAAAGSGLYLLLPEGRLDSWFWCLAIAALMLAAVSGLFWIFERPKQTLLLGSSNREPLKRAE